MFVVLVGTINNSDFNEISNCCLFRLIKDVCIAFSRQASSFGAAVLLQMPWLSL